MDEVKIKGASHITGGGFYENIPREASPQERARRLKKPELKVLPRLNPDIAKAGNISERDMFNTYNMGVGMSNNRIKERR